MGYVLPSPGLVHRVLLLLLVPVGIGISQFGWYTLDPIIPLPPPHSLFSSILCVEMALLSFDYDYDLMLLCFYQIWILPCVRV